QTRLNECWCKDVPCPDGHVECKKLNDEKFPRKVKITYRPKLLKKILMTHFQGVKVGGKGDNALSGKTLQYSFHIGSVGGAVYRDDDAICEGEYEDDSFIWHQVRNCRTAEDFYGS